MYKFVTRDGKLYRQEFVHGSAKPVNECLITRPVRFDRDDVEIAEEIPRVHYAGETFCLADSRPAKAIFRVMDAKGGSPDIGPVWILKVLEAPADKLFTPEAIDELKAALLAGDTDLALRILDA
jgi:hypothetical protein